MSRGGFIAYLDINSDSLPGQKVKVLPGRKSAPGQVHRPFPSARLRAVCLKEYSLGKFVFWPWLNYSPGWAVKRKGIQKRLRMRNMRMRMKISSTLSTYKYLPKMATFWVKNGSAWLCFQFWVPKISLLFIPLGFIHPQEWKLRVQNHKILVKKRWFFLLLMRFMRIDAHLMRIDAHQQK